MGVIFMNKKSGYYFKKGRVEAHFVYRNMNFKQKLCFLIYLFVSFVGKLIIFSRPFFAIADENVGKMVSETRDLNLAEAFHGSNNSKKYFALLGTYFVRDLSLAAVAFIGSIPHLMYKGVQLDSPGVYNELIGLIFQIVSLVFIVLAVVIGALRYTAAGYIGANLNDAETSDVMFLARVHNRKVVGTAFWSYFVQAIVILPFIGGGIYGIMFFNRFGMEFFWPLISVGIVLLWILFGVWFFGVTCLSQMTVRYNAYKDRVVLRKPISVKEVSGEELSYAPLYDDEGKELEALSISQMKKREGK